MAINMLTALGTSKWSRYVLENAPCERVGHTMNIAGPYLCVYGGRTQQTYHNDLHVVDLNDLGSTNPAWRRDPYIMSTSLVPQKRVRHTMVTFRDRLYLYASKSCHCIAN